MVGQYIYSNQVIAHDVPSLGIKSEIPLLEEKGFLKTHIFLPDSLRTVTDDNQIQVGHALAMTACSVPLFNLQWYSPSG